MHEKLIRGLSKTVGTIWLVIGIYGIAAAFLSERDRLTMLVIGAFFATAGIWMICARNPIGALGNKRD
jgi:hypothetical protein